MNFDDKKPGLILIPLLLGISLCFILIAFDVILQSGLIKYKYIELLILSLLSVLICFIFEIFESVRKFYTILWTLHRGVLILNSIWIVLLTKYLYEYNQVPNSQEIRVFVENDTFSLLKHIAVHITISGILTVLILTILTLKEQLNQKKRTDIIYYLDRLNRHRVLVGYGQTGVVTLEEMLKNKDSPKSYLIWDNPVDFTHGAVVVEGDETKIPYIVGDHPVTGKIGYIEIPGWGNKKNKRPRYLCVPVLVSDICSKPVQKLLKLDKAETITSSHLNFERNLSIADYFTRPKENEHSNDSQSAVKPAIVLPCAVHAEREILEEKVRHAIKLQKISKAEILQVNEHTGFTLADCAKAKISGLEKFPGGKILICGNYNLYYILEGLILNNASFLVGPARKREDFLRNVVVFDQRLSTDGGQINEGEQREIRDFLDLTSLPNVGLWRASFCLTAPHLVREFTHKVVAVPVIKEEPYQFLTKFIENWQPDLILLLYSSKEECVNSLKLIDWYWRWHDLPLIYNPKPPTGAQRVTPEIIVSVPDEDLALWAIDRLREDFGIHFGVYAPFISIGRELALLENMLHGMIKSSGR